MIVSFKSITTTNQSKPRKSKQTKANHKMTNSKNTFCVSYEHFKEWIMNDDEEEMKKYGFDEDYDYEDFIEGEYEYLECDRGACYSRVRFIIPVMYKGKEAEYKRTMVFNTSSPFALWMCGINDDRDEDNETDETDESEE